MTTAAITVILGVIAVCTFWMKGKQWPTFITATLFGIFLGTTPVGSWARDLVENLMGALNSWLGHQ